MVDAQAAEAGHLHLLLPDPPVHAGRVPGRQVANEPPNLEDLRRTRLANERTYLAWWRTGLTAFAVAIGSGKLVPALATGTNWPYTAIGIGFAALGVGCSGYGLRRYREVQRAIGTGEPAAGDDRMVIILSGAAVVLGLLLVIVLIVTET